MELDQAENEISTWSLPMSRRERLTAMFAGLRKQKKLDIGSEKVPQSQREPKVAHMPVSKLPTNFVPELFGIKDGEHGIVWKFAQNELRGVPDNLTSILADYQLATGGSPENEALMRCRIDAILLTCLAAQKRVSNHESGSSILSVHIQTETDILLPWTYKGDRKMVTGITDYSLWYQTPGDMECNLLVVEAKKRLESGDAQALAYMSMLHHTRRDDTSIYGIATDSYKWSFLYLDNNSRWSNVTYQWNETEKHLVVSMIHKIIRHAAALSKEEFRLSAIGAGTKRTLSKNSLLEGFFHKRGRRV